MVARVRRKARLEVGPLALPIPSPKSKMASSEDGSLRLTDTLAPEALLAFADELAGYVEAGTVEPPAWVEVGYAGEASRVSRGPDASSAEWARTLARFARVALTAPGALWFAFALDCGCGVRVEVRRG